MRKFLIISITIIIILLILAIVLLCLNLLQKNNENDIETILSKYAKKFQQEQQSGMAESYRLNAKYMISTLNQAILLSAILEERDLTGLNSKQLTDVISERLICNRINTNKILLNNGMFIEFIGNNKCEKGGCKIIVDLNGNDIPNKKWLNPNKPSDIIELKLKKDKIVLKKEETKDKVNDVYSYKALPAKFMKCENNDITNCN